MADAAISALSSRNAILGTDQVVVVPSGSTTQKTTVDRLLRRSTVVLNTTQALTAGTTNQYITASGLILPAAPNLLTVVRYSIVISKAAAGGTGPQTWTLKCGTTGSVVDATLGSFSLGTNSAVADVGKMDILATFNSVGSTGVVQMSAAFSHSLASTGLNTVPVQIVNATSGATDFTVSNLIFGVALLPGTTNAITVTQVVGEIINV